MATLSSLVIKGKIMRTALNIILQTSSDLGMKGSDNLRSGFYVNTKIAEEIWEIDEEIQKIKKGEAPGKDGVAGEAIDTFISAVDLYALYAMNEGYDVEQMEAWLNKAFDAVDIEEYIKEKSQASNPDALSLLDVLFKETGQASRVAIENSLIMDGVSYKTCTKEEAFSSFVVLMEKSLDVFYAATSELSDEMKADSFTNTVLKKVNKWREKRDLNILSPEIEVKRKMGY